MSRFANLLSSLPEGGEKERIQKALDTSEIVDEDDLRAIVAGSSNAEATALFREDDFLSKFDASALAGILVPGTSGTSDDFFLKNKTLTGLGMTTQAEQYGFYISCATPVLGSLIPLRKAYWLGRWIHEKDADRKIMIAVRANLSASEQAAAKVFLNHYRSTPKRLAFIPITFVLFEATRFWWKRSRK